MNTSASDAMVPGRTRPQPFQRTLAMLRACAPRPAVRVLCALAMALLVAGAVLVTVYAASPGSGAIGTVTLVSFAVAAPWALWCSRLLLLRMEAQAWRMPALSAAIPVALLHVLLATVAVPAVLLVLLAGAEPLFTVSCLALAAMAGLFAAMLPRWFYLAMCFAPLAWLVVSSLAIRMRGLDALQLDVSTLFATWQLPWLALLATLAAAWRWRAIVRDAGKLRSQWRQPAVLASRAGASSCGADMTDPGQWQARALDWLWPAGRASEAGPERPLRAMRTILGTPFAPLTRPQVATQLGMAVLAMAALALIATTGLDHEKLHSVLNGGLAGGLGGGGMVLVSMYGWRLEQLRRRPAGEMAEFALLPGWGDAVKARRTLLHAAARPMAYAALWVTTILAVICVALGIGVAGMAWLLVAITGTCLLAMLACLRPLSGQAMLPPWMFILVAVALSLLVASTLVATRPDWSAAIAGWLAGGWFALYLACGIGLLQAWRRYRARPHPFLQE